MLLGYVGADYGGAVSSGRVEDPEEYAEQLEFLGEARRILQGLPPVADSERLSSALERLVDDVKSIAPTERVALACRALRTDILELYRVATAPAHQPDRAAGAALYAKTCARCHGVTGRADTPEARALEVPPRAFVDPEVLSTLSPERAFSVMTFGLDGTPMASFEALPARARWDLAFYLFQFAHKAPERPAGLPPTLIANPPSLARLAAFTDRELARELTNRGVPSGQLGAAMSWARTLATYSPPAVHPRERIAAVQDLVVRAMDTYEAGDPDRALDLSLRAYLEEFEPAEAPLSVANAEAVRLAEVRFMDLREAIRNRQPVSRVRSAAVRLEGALAKLGEIERSDTTTAGAAAFLILLREGAEAVLLVGLLLGLLSRAKRKDLERWIHLGWIGALVAGVATWFATDRGMALSGANREGLEGVIALVAAIVLLWVSASIFSPSGHARWMRLLREKLQSTTASGPVSSLVLASFLAVYREAFETVLFLQALRLSHPDQDGALIAGAAAAMGVLVAAVLVMKRIGRRVPLRQFFILSGLLLCILAAYFAGAGLQALREAAWIPGFPLGLPRLPAIGVYPDALALTIQALILGSLAVPYLRKQRSDRLLEEPEGDASR